MTSQPKTVETMSLISKDIYSTYSNKGKIKVQISVDVIARVNGWFQKKHNILRLKKFGENSVHTQFLFTIPA